MSTEQNKIKYVHQNPNQEATTPGALFHAFKEDRLDFGEKKLFYTIEMVVVDMSCCGGTVASGIATVYGYVDQWKSRRNEQGDFITFIEPVKDQGTQMEISGIIRQKEMIDQVNFK